jgi:hypothetical protein
LLTADDMPEVLVWVVVVTLVIGTFTLADW